MRTDELDFQLPPDLIAQTPTADRAASRLLRYRRLDRSIEHRAFADLPGLLRRGDLLVFNDSRVIPARFSLRKPTGGIVEGLFLSQTAPGRWRVMLRNPPPLPPLPKGDGTNPPLPLAGEGRGEGPLLHFVDHPTLAARILANHGGGEYEIEVDSSAPALVVLSSLGRMPLPPYIRREKLHDQRDALDRVRYQTVYARHDGAIAAPTAGLHFTPGLLAALADDGIERTFVTLHVGMGTFKPVAVSDLADHRMHSEWYSIPPEAAEALNRARREGRRIIAVGTTSARVLESQPADQPFVARDEQTDIFIRPPYQWKHVRALITNFHLPRSTLIALVAAMVGLDEQRRIYRLAIEQRYRFFSYGDAMLLE